MRSNTINSLRLPFAGLLLLFFCPMVLQAQESLKGYDKLVKSDYPKAFEIFKGVLIDDDSETMANFGMAKLYSNRSFPDFNLFKAFEFIRKAKAGAGKLSSVGLAPYEKKIQDFKGVIEQEYTTIENKLKDDIIKSPAIEKAKLFVELFPDSQYWLEIMQIRNHEFFLEAQKNNTVKGFNKFIEQFPDAADKDEAIKLRDEVAYQDLLSNEKLQGAYDFLDRYPNSEKVPYVIIIRDSLEFESARSTGTEDAFSTYLKRFPMSRQCDKAIELYILKRYERAQQRNTKDDYQDFINRYFSCSDDGVGAKRMLDNLQYDEIEQPTTTVDDYNKYITWAPNSPYKKKAIAMRDQKAYENAVGGGSIELLEEFIYNYPYAPQFKMALEKRDSILFVQCSNLITTETFFEFLKSYPTLAQKPRALEILEKIEFKEAEAENTKEAYQRFLDKYPASLSKKLAEEKMRKAK